MKILVHQSNVGDVLKRIKPQQNVKVIRVVDYYNEPIHPEALLISGLDHRIVDNMDVPHCKFKPHPEDKKYNEKLKRKIENQK